jgi:hypothetical protein
MYTKYPNWCSWISKLTTTLLNFVYWFVLLKLIASKCYLMGTYVQFT